MSVGFRSLASLAALGAALLCFAAPAAAQAPAPTVRSTHGDWEIRCNKPAGATTEQCALMQVVLAEDRDNVGVTVIVLKTADKKSRIFRVLAPLGVLLESSTFSNACGFVRKNAGLGLQIQNDVNAQAQMAAVTPPAGAGANAPNASLTFAKALPSGISVKKCDTVTVVDPAQPNDPKVLTILDGDARKMQVQWTGKPPASVSVRSYTEDVGQVSFTRCLPNGCIAEVILDDSLLAKLRSGAGATFVIWQTPEEGVGIPISLKGFGDGYDKLP